MPADTTTVDKLPTAGPGLNKPASGTYGEGAALDRLKSQLPLSGPSGPTGPEAPPPMPLPPSGAGMSTAPAAGVPSVLLSPTTRPGDPVGSPLAAAPVSPLQGAQTGRQQRLAILDAVSQDPNVSDETREFVDMLKRRLIAGSVS